MDTLRKDERRARDEAAAWFSRLKQSPVSEAAIEEFFAWRRAPANAAAYAEVEARLRQLDRVRNDPELVGLTEAALRRPDLWTRLRAAVAPRLLIGGLVAAAVLLGLAAILWTRAPTYSTQVGAQQIVRLDDGSVMRLNTDSQVEVRYRPGERRLRLRRGEAFFEVAHDPARPFIVEAGDTRVRAIGTRFDVRRLAKATSVTLVEGRVRVARASRPGAWTLAPNQQITLNGGPAAPRAADAAQATSWTTGLLRFHETPLSSAVEEVNRYSRTKVRLRAGPVGEVRVSGVFETGDTAAFISAVTELFGLTATTTADGVVLSAGPDTAPG